MSKIFPKKFIEDTLIKEIGSIYPKHAYLSFILIANGIEFLGKCIDTKKQAWHWSATYSCNHQPFDCAVQKLFPAPYRKLLKAGFRDQLRNGMSHSLLPKSRIALTEKANDPEGDITFENHPFYDKRKEKYVLVVEYFYTDFVSACEKVISRNFSKLDKMSRAIITFG